MRAAVETAAFVLARAGSKGVPGKNLALVAGRPCAAWALDAALQAQRVHAVVLSSDAPALLDLARRLGATPVRRRPEDATDGAPVVRALWQAVRDAACAAGRIVLLYGNVPVRPEGLIDRAVELHERTGADSVQSYAPVGKHHPLWQARIEPDGTVRPWQGDRLFGGVHRRQDLPPAFVPDGGVLVVSRAALERGAAAGAGPHEFLGADHRGVLTGEGEVIDIDSPIDLLVADAVLRQRARVAA